MQVHRPTDLTDRLTALADPHFILLTSLLLQLELNARKYPAAIVRGKAAKYDAYSEQTGIGRTKAGQRTGEAAAAVCRPPWRAPLTLAELRARLRRFVEERDWAQVSCL